MKYKHDQGAENYPGYHIDINGIVWSTLSRPHTVQEPHTIARWQKNGYWAVTLSVSKTRNPRRRVTEYVHRLVLETFVGPAPAGHQCLHRNGNRKDDRPSNLYWGTCHDNQLDRVTHGTDHRGIKHKLHKLTPEDVIKIRGMIAQGVFHDEIAPRFGVHKSTIFKIAIGGSWAWLQIPLPSEVAA